MNHAEIQTFLGAYALDALDPEEWDIVTAHLEECPRCRAEVSTHLETAAFLGNVGADAPAGVWDRIAAEISGPRDDALPPLAPPRPPRVRFGRPALVLLAAAALVVIAMAVGIVRLDHRVSRLQSTLSATAQRGAGGVVVSPDGRRVALRSADGTMTANALVGGDGQAVLLSSDLPALVAGRTYQLWGLADGRVVSLGLLGPDPRVVPFRVDQAVSQLMVTAEPAGGVPAPDGPVLMQGEIPAA